MISGHNILCVVEITTPRYSARNPILRLFTKSSMFIFASIGYTDFRSPHKGPSGENLETKKKIFRVDRREISFLRFIFEGYDGIAVVSTLDREADLISISVAPGCESEVAGVLADLSRQVLMEPVSGPAV